MADVLILDFARTPIGSFNGSLSNVPVTRLGALVIESLLKKTNVRPDEVDEVILGNVLSAGVGQAPARQAAFNKALKRPAHVHQLCPSPSMTPVNFRAGRCRRATAWFACVLIGCR